MEAPNCWVVIKGVGCDDRSGLFLATALETNEPGSVVFNPLEFVVLFETTADILLASTSVLGPNRRTPVFIFDCGSPRVGVCDRELGLIVEGSCC